MDANECTGVAYRAVQWAKQSPDVYAGETCDQVKARWVVGAEGDMDGPEPLGPLLELRAETFPPGTVVVVREPVCPDCGEPRHMASLPTEPVAFQVKCDCGFDWEDWTIGEFS